MPAAGGISTGSFAVQALKLPDKRHAPSMTLSGGMKRKLSCAIAFVGGSKGSLRCSVAARGSCVFFV